MLYKECPNSKLTLSGLVLLAATLFLFGCGHSTEAFLAKGEEFLAKRKFYDAMMQFRAAAESDSGSSRAHWGLARSYENLGRFNETLDELRKTVEIDPSNLDAKARLGNYFLLVQPPLISETEKIQEEIIATDPNFVEGYILKASILATMNRPEDEVVAKINEAIAIDPKRTETYLSLSRYYVSREMVPEAEAAIRQGIAVNPNAAIGMIEYGRFLSFGNRNDEAEAQFRNAIAVEPSNIEARESIANFYVTSRQFEKAEAEYRELVSIQENSPESRLDLADFYAVTERQQDAIEVLAGIIAETPEYARARYRLGQIYLDQKNIEGVNEQLQALLNINDSDTTALMLRARLRMLEGKNDEAVKDLEDVLKVQPSERDALFYMSQAKIALGQFDQARAFISDLERYHPTFIKAGLLRIQAAFASGDSEGALKLAGDLYARASTATPNGENTAARLEEVKLRALSARGLAYLDLRKFAEARADLGEIVRLSPKSISGMINLAKVNVATSESQEALKLYERVLSIDPANFDALSGIVNVSINTANTAFAHARLDDAIARNEGRADVLAALHYLRSTVFTAEKNNTAAENEVRTSIELDADYLPAYSSYASLLVARNETAAAIEQYTRVVEKSPSASVYTLLGILEDSRSDYAKAEANYRRALELAPDTPIAANNLAWLIAENQGNLDEALQLASMSVSKNQAVAGFYDTLGWIYFKKGLFSPAVEQMRKAVSLDEQSGNAPNPAYRVRLGIALASAGDKASAKREVETSLKNASALSLREVNDAKRVLATL